MGLWTKDILRLILKHILLEFLFSSCFWYFVFGFFHANTGQNEFKYDSNKKISVKRSFSFVLPKMFPLHKLLISVAVDVSSFLSWDVCIIRTTLGSKQKHMPGVQLWDLCMFSLSWNKRVMTSSVQQLSLVSILLGSRSQERALVLKAICKCIETVFTVSFHKALAD